MKIKGAARYLSYRCLFWTMLLLVFLLPFVFITSALVTLEGANKCSSIGMRSAPTILTQLSSGGIRNPQDLDHR
jgi:alpha-1,4-galacturonosyltransferase